jgi:hypothetical protein
MTHHQHEVPDATHYPIDNVVALFESREAAESAKSALTAAGFDGGDIVLFHGAEGLRSIQARETPLTRLDAALDRLTQDEGVARATYMNGLRDGHSLMLVYAPDEATVDRASAVLQRYDVTHLAALHKFTFEAL